jgi:hypothetical protein
VTFHLCRQDFADEATVSRELVSTGIAEPPSIEIGPHRRVGRVTTPPNP